jgi:RecA-family ATPase
MRTNDLRQMPMPEIRLLEETASGDWLWHGYLRPGKITLLTSLWKCGKTTLMTGLLQRMERDGEFLGRSVRRGRVLVVSEESLGNWAERLKYMPVGPHVQLLSRPFRGAPSNDEWNTLVDQAHAMRTQDELDLLVIDPLAVFLPANAEADGAALRRIFEPLHRLAADGAGVLLLHHPRR